jgi:hypothetical protein
MPRKKDGHWFDRFALSFMGPPQVGDLSAPVREIAQPVRLCPKCGISYDDHEVVRDPRLTWTRCPTPATEQAGARTAPPRPDP